MKKINIEITLIVLSSLFFLGANDIVPENAIIVTKLICIVIAGINSFLLSTEYIKNKDNESTVQENQYMMLKKEMSILVDEQKRINTLFANFENNIDKLINKLEQDNFEKSDEIKRLLSDEISQNNIRMEKVMNGFQNSADSIVKTNHEQNSKIIELIRILNCDISEFFNKNDEKLNTAIKGLIESEDAYSKKFENLFIKMNNQNTKAFEQTIKGLNQVVEEENQNRNKYFLNLENTMSNIVQRLVDNQNNNSMLVIDLLNGNKDLYSSYIDEMNKLDTIQQEMLEIEQEINQDNKEIIVNINNSINKFIDISEAIKEQTGALKAYISDFSNQSKKKMDMHYSNISDKLGDLADDLEDILIKFNENYKKECMNQTNSLVQSIGKIEDTLNKTITNVLDKNSELITYIEKVQDEWTSLNKNEIEFLSKVWESK